MVDTKEETQEPTFTYHKDGETSVAYVKDFSDKGKAIFHNLKLDRDDENTLLFVGPGETRIDIYHIVNGTLQTRSYLHGRRFRISMWYTAT